MSSPVTVVEVDSYKKFLEKIEEVVETYKSTGVVVLRGHRFSDEEHMDLARSLGDYLDWNMFSGSEGHTESSFYHGGHSELEDEKTYGLKKDDYLLDWHIEQVYYVSPILAGVWNMYHFTAQPGTGNTNFIDSCKLFEDLSEEEQDFLLKSTMYWKKQAQNHSGPYYTKAVDFHPLSGKATLRIETDRGCEVHPELYLFDKRDATELEKSNFKNIVEKIKSRLHEDKTILHYQEWQEGDLLIVDLFRMYHSVMGGFSRGERKFKGLGMRPKTYNHDLYDSLETLWKN